MYIGRGVCNIPFFLSEVCIAGVFEIPLASHLLLLSCLELTGCIYVRLSLLLAIRKNSRVQYTHLNIMHKMEIKKFLRVYLWRDRTLKRLMIIR